MSPKLAAYTYLRSHNLIERVSDADYRGCVAGDHVFLMDNDAVVFVDLVIEKHRIEYLPTSWNKY